MRKLHVCFRLIVCLLMLAFVGCHHTNTQPTQTEPELPVIEETMINHPVLTFENTVHDFGIVAPHSINECDYLFQNTGSQTLEMEEKIEAVCGCTIPSLDKTVYTPDEQGAIHVVFRAEGDIEHVTKEIKVRSNDPEQPISTLTVKAHVTPRVVCEPSHLPLLPKLDNGNCPTITLHSIDDVPFSITQASEAHQWITVPVDSTREATKWTLQPKVNTAELAARNRGVLVLGLSHPGCKESQISFQVLPEYQFSPERLGLYNIKGDAPIMYQVRVQNNYGESFEIQSIQSQQGRIKVTSQTPVTLPDDHLFYYELKLTITPPQSGSFWDVLVVQLTNGTTLKLPCPGRVSKTP